MKIEPLQSVLMMVFFVSIGLLIDLKVVWASLGTVFLLMVAAMFVKTILCMFLLQIFLPSGGWRCSYVTGLAISQIGEFSFVLAISAADLGIISNQSYKLLVAVIALSIAFSPLWLPIMKHLGRLGSGAQAA